MPLKTQTLSEPFSFGWDSGFNLCMGHCWWMAPNSTLPGPISAERTGAAARLRGQTRGWGWRGPAKLGAERPPAAGTGCLSTEPAPRAILGNAAYRLGWLSESPACALFQQNRWRTKREQLDYCTDETLSR